MAQSLANLIESIAETRLALLTTRVEVDQNRLRNNLVTQKQGLNRAALHEIQKFEAAELALAQQRAAIESVLLNEPEVADAIAALGKTRFIRA